MHNNNNMVPQQEDVSDRDYITGDEGEASPRLYPSVKDEKDEKISACTRVKVVKSFPKLPKLKSPEELPQLLSLMETILLEEGFSDESLNLLSVKMEGVNSLSDCSEVYSMAKLLISRPWIELKSHLLNSFASTARMRAEANVKLAQLKFDRDLIANRIRSLSDWFSLHDSSMSAHEFTTRVFNTKIFPPRYLEKIIERAEARYPGCHWRRVPISQLCDIVEEVCLLFSELDSVNPKVDRPELARRLKQEGGASKGPDGKSGGWLEGWLKDFKKVYYVTDGRIASQIQAKADDSRKLMSRRTPRPYYLIGFKDGQAAVDAVKDIDPTTFREFRLKNPLN